MEERLRKRLEEKGHTDPDKALEQLGIEVEQKGHPRFDETGFMWYGTFITDPTKDESGRFTVDPVVYYSRHYEDWLKWKANRGAAEPVQSYDSQVEEKDEWINDLAPTLIYDPQYEQAIITIGSVFNAWVRGVATDPSDVSRVREWVLDEIRKQMRG